MPDAPPRALRARPGHPAPRQAPEPDRKLAELVSAARTGDNSAWTQLIRRLDGTLRAIARSYRLAPTDIDDVVQASWLALLEDIQEIREPTAIAGWLATATRRKALRVRQAPVREQLTDDPDLGDRPDPNGPEATLLAAERRAVLARALATLPGRHRQLMTVLLTQPELDYRQVGELLSMPIGSIGPIRARSLTRLSRHPQLRALRNDPPALPVSPLVGGEGDDREADGDQSPRRGVYRCTCTLADDTRPAAACAAC